MLAETVSRLDPRPALLLASAVGYYGQRGDEELTEESAAGEGFLADVVREWEAAAEPARAAGARVVHFRQGLVLAKDGGALKRMLLPFRLGVGGRVGSGSQWWSWVSLDDVVAAYLHALEHPLEGVYNLAAPGVVRNRDFVDALGQRPPSADGLPAAGLRREARVRRDGRGDAPRRPARAAGAARRRRDSVRVPGDRRTLWSTPSVRGAANELVGAAAARHGA